MKCVVAWWNSNLIKRCFWLQFCLLSRQTLLLKMDWVATVVCCSICEQFLFSLSMFALRLTVLFQILSLLFCHCFASISPWKFVCIIKNMLRCSSKSAQSLPRCYMNFISYSIQLQLPKSECNLYCCHSQNWSFGTIFCHFMLYVTTTNMPHKIVQFTKSALLHCCFSEYEAKRSLNN